MWALLPGSRPQVSRPRPGARAGTWPKQAQGQLQEQAVEGQQRIARKPLSLSDEFSPDGSELEPGRGGRTWPSRYYRRARDAGHWLEKREPGQVVNEVQSFALP